MKNINIAMLLLLILTATSSCKKDFLDLSPESTLTEETYFKTTQQVEAGVIACYDGLQNTMQFEYQLTTLRSDEMAPYLFEGDWGSTNGFTETSGNFFNLNFWSNSYNCIARANLVLKNIDNVTDAAKKPIYQAEAKFIRAHNHYNLVRLFGDVPLITERIAYNATDKFVRTPAADVYTQIISDLQDAAANLPSTWASSSKGRITKWTAKAMLANVYLTMKNYTAAKPLIDEVVAANLYALQPVYANLFSLTNELNSEILYAVSYKASSSGEGQAFTYEYSKIGATTGFKPQQELINLFVPADQRFATSIGGVPAKLLVNKYVDASAPTRDAGNDLIIIRYADVLLMKAEINANLKTAAMANPAAMSDQDSTDIIAPWNLVRTRAGLPAITKSTYAGLSTFMNGLMTERNIEFCFENKRWYDLLRTKTATELVSLMNAHFAFNGRPSLSMKTTQTLMAIPQTDIDLAGGVLKQNPGY